MYLHNNPSLLIYLRVSGVRGQQLVADDMSLLDTGTT